MLVLSKGENQCTIVTLSRPYNVSTGVLLITSTKAYYNEKQHQTRQAGVQQSDPRFYQELASLVPDALPFTSIQS